MKKVVITITAAIFALGLTSAGLAQTTQTPVKPSRRAATISYLASNSIRICYSQRR